MASGKVRVCPAMSVSVLCDSCGRQVPVPAGHGPRKLRCPDCGVYCDVPPPTNAQIATFPERNERMRATPAPATLETLLEGTDEDDGKPYRVVGDAKPSEPCPECSKLVPRGSIICNHCGFNRQTGTTIQRVHEKVDKQWEPDFRFSVRFGTFLAVQGFVAAIFLSLVDGSWFTLAAPWLIGGVLLAFILGSYARLNLTRNSKGRIRLTKTWRICFVPLGASDMLWRDYEVIVTSQSHDDGFLDWVILLLLLPWGIIPGVLWWFYVLKADLFDVSLLRDHGSSALLLFRSRSQPVALEIAEAIRNITGLR